MNDSNSAAGFSVPAALFFSSFSSCWTVLQCIIAEFNSFASSSGFSSPSSSSGRRMAAYVHYPSSSGRRIGFSGILVILEVSNYQTVWERKTIRMRRSRSKHGSAPCAATSMSVPSRRRIARSAASRGSISTQSNSRLGLAFAGLPVSAAPLSCSRGALVVRPVSAAPSPAHGGACGSPVGEPSSGRTALVPAREVWASRATIAAPLRAAHDRPPAAMPQVAGKGVPTCGKCPQVAKESGSTCGKCPQVGGGVQTLPAGVAPWCRALEAFCPPEAAIGGGYENNLAGATPSGRPPGPSTLPGPDFLPGPGRLMCL